MLVQKHEMGGRGIWDEEDWESRANGTKNEGRRGEGEGCKRSREKWFAKFRGPRSTRWKKEQRGTNLRSIVVYTIFLLGKKKRADEREKKKGGREKFDESILVLLFEKRTNNENA